MSRFPRPTLQRDLLQEAFDSVRVRSEFNNGALA